MEVAFKGFSSGSVGWGGGGGVGGGGGSIDGGGDSGSIADSFGSGFASCSFTSAVISNEESAATASKF